MNCRGCGAKLTHKFVDLGAAPPSNAYLAAGDLLRPEEYYPLRVLVCDACWLCQTEDFVASEHMFDENYAYFSSFSTMWLDHAKRYASYMVDRFSLTGESHVLEVAANDGYLLQYFKALGIPCLGVEPTRSTADAAREKGIEIIGEFFGQSFGQGLRDKGITSDLIAANNVLAHVPDVNDFVSGFRVMLKPHGVVTCEFPHLLNLIDHRQFDTIYHEHYSYFSLLAVSAIFRRNGLDVFDVEELPTHGGSLRLFGCLPGAHPESDRVGALLARERAAGLDDIGAYGNFQERVNKIKDDFVSFLIEQKRQGRRVVGYGAAAKANTLMNYAGIRPDLVEYVVDRNPAKIGKYLPGSRIPIVDEERLSRDRPDIVVIFPWNLMEEVVAQLHYVRDWSGRFCVAIPELKVF
ncbi:class I SAM-dependent methyltransferase [Thalassobaculum salexigens]|uniref:class I SAM-dependent methyltransferase n=1 Tax=Thalassobaculum salexigens TaxID=455360 RepID=UPI0003F61971|nr:class I SAM-dependent methyltransferase [Thalassobaculum salexigens]